MLVKDSIAGDSLGKLRSFVRVDLGGIEGERSWDGVMVSMYCLDFVAVRDMDCSDVTDCVFTVVGLSDNTPDGMLVV